jgi:hypothetical protein
MASAREIETPISATTMISSLTATPLDLNIESS